MAAGLGFKTFVTGEVLTAGDTNGYLMQGINVFASAAARDAAITAPAEGQFAFTKDTNGLWYYDGAAWVASGATGDIEGVTAGVGISGGGTSGTVTVTNSMATAIDAKGDLVAGTAADTFSRLAVGTNDQVLTADSTAATGLKWSTLSSGGMTSIATYTANNTSGTWTVSSIPSTYKHIFIVGQGLQSNNASLKEIAFRFNGDTGASYTYGFIRAIGGTVDAGGGTVGSSNPAAFAEIPVTSAGTTSLLEFMVTIPLYASSSYKGYNGQAMMGNSSRTMYVSSGTWASTSAINSITIALDAANFKVGTMTMYGVN
jgi:hypothetical protein